MTVRMPLTVRSWLSLAVALALLCAVLSGKLVAQETESPDRISVVYLGKAYEEPPPLSLLEKILTDEGLAGARLGIRDNNTTGTFLNQEFVLDEVVVPADGDVVARAKEVLAAGPALIVADLKPDDLLAVADLPEAQSSIILNARSSRDELREKDCRANVFHIMPSFAMRADALAQYLIWKRWNDWLLIKGISPDDDAYTDAVKRAAKRFGGKIVEERIYEFDAGSRRTDSGHQQIQTQMPQLTQGAKAHDVIWVADVGEAFGEYLLFRTYEPAPVVGTQGLVAVAWHRAYEQYAGTQLQHAFEDFAHRIMTERDYAAWLAVRVLGEAATRTQKTDVTSLREYILSDQFRVAGFKGQQMTFRSWDHQLRQPILIAGPRALVSMSPQEGFLHEHFPTDTLGIDAPESKCRFPG
jgi:ABC transporter substrate binding protein (PQQ-dependent alcohol dehydrogenase system)